MSVQVEIRGIQIILRITTRIIHVFSNRLINVKLPSVIVSVHVINLPTTVLDFE